VGCGSVTESRFRRGGVGPGTYLVDIQRAPNHLLGNCGRKGHEKVWLDFTVFAFLALDYSLLDETHWQVGVFYPNGSRAPGDPVPWNFHANNTVNAKNLWQGTWQAQDGNTIDVVISTPDEFVVDFINSNEFIAYKKNRQPYRWGRRVGAPEPID
jgi:hypothetical protein